MEVTNGGKESLLSAVRPYRIGILPSGALNKSEIHT